MTFQEYRFRNVASLINGRAYLMPELQDSGKYKIVRVGNFTGKDEWFFSDMELEPEKYCENGDLLYKWACTFGPEIWKGDKTIYHYHIWKVLCNPVLLDKTFFFYYLKYYTPLWLSGTNGATMVHITKASMEKKKLYLPTLPQQQKIASILSAYDSQIEINQKRIKLLEQMAENLYKEWFVRFRFPGYETAEFEDGLPKGWRCGKLKNIAQDSGKSEKKDNRDKYPAYVPIDCIGSHSMVLGSMDSIENAESSLVSFKKTDILFGAMRPYFHKVIMAPFSGLTRSTCFVISPKNESYRYFLYLLLFQKSSIDYATTICVGSTMPYTVWKDYSRMPIVIPTEDIVIRFAKVVKPIIDSIESIYFCNNYLVKQRDLLLPRLMSGKLSI